MLMSSGGGRVNSIHLLPETLINKIKAGEMIARPANALKELLENAIDAGATRITIALEKGGSTEIVVSDNGAGIAPDDVPLAIKRHATSKINCAADLEALHSLGFRGEALASIAEVSRFTLTSATATAKIGARLTYDGNTDVMPWTCTTGTSVSVKDIFYNVPARRKFLKNPATEYAHCHTCVQALAISHPQIEFIMRHNNKEQLRVAAIPQAKGEEALRLRAAALFGKENISPLLYAQDKNEMAEVALLFSPPGHDRAHNRHIFTFVNARWVKSTTLRYAILRGYHSHLLKGRYPLVLAYLQVPPSLLDVNVHPMKHEVRFQYDKDVQELLAINLRRQLRTPTWSTTPTPHLTTSPLSVASPPPAAASFTATPRPTPPHPPTTTAGRAARVFYPPSRSTDTSAAAAKSGTQPPAGQLDWATLIYIGTAARCYLLFEDRQRNLIVIDQHAFHERIIFEQLQAEPQKLTRGQQLTIAAALALTATEVAVVKARQAEFDRLGFTLEAVSECDVLLRGVPALLQQRDYIGAVQALLALAQQDATPWFGESLLHDVVATLACRAAVKAGDLLETPRLQQLLVAARGVDFYHNCPHGRRVIRIFTPPQVGSWFDRF